MRELEQRDGHRRPAFYELATARDRGPQIAGEIQAEDILQHRIQADETLRIVGLGVPRRGRNDCARIADAVQTLECVCSLGPAFRPPIARAKGIEEAAHFFDALRLRVCEVLLLVRVALKVVQLGNREVDVLHSISNETA